MVNYQVTRISLAILGCTLAATPSYAYLDPGTGSVILQSALAGIAVAMGVLRLYWYRIKSFFGWQNQQPDTQESQKSEVENES